MKKVFSIFLTCAMLLNVGIVAMADGDAATEPVDLFAAWGDFETIPENVDEANYGGYITVDPTNMELSVAEKTGVDNSNALYLKFGQGVTPVIHAEGLETGAVYELSVWCLKKYSGSRLTMGLCTYTGNNNNEDGIFAVIKDENNAISELKKSKQKEPSDTNSAGSKDLINGTPVTIKAEFYIPESEEATIDVDFGFGVNSARNGMYIDNISLVKVGTMGSIEGSAVIEKPAGEGATAQYTLSGDMLNISDVELIGEYGTAVTFDNGTLTVSAEATGTVTLGVKKIVNGEEAVIISKDIEIREAVPAGPVDLFADWGNFETIPESVEKVTVGEGDAAVEYISNYGGYITADPASIELREGAGQGVDDSNALFLKFGKGVTPVIHAKGLETGAVYELSVWCQKVYAGTRLTMGLCTYTGNNNNEDGIFAVVKDENNAISELKKSKQKEPSDTNCAGSKDLTNGTPVTIKAEFYIPESEEATIDVDFGFGVNQARNGMYIDNISLVKVGTIGSIAGEAIMDAPATDAATYEYTLGGDMLNIADVELISEHGGAVAFENGTLTVSPAATGLIKLGVRMTVNGVADVILPKEIVLFDRTGKCIDLSDGVYRAYVKNDVAPSGKLLVAKYGTAFEDVETTNSTSMDGYWTISKTADLTNGTYKFMLWDGFDNMKPIADAETVTVAAE